MNDEVMFVQQDDAEALNIVDDTIDSQKYLIFMADHSLRRLDVSPLRVWLMLP